MVQIASLVALAALLAGEACAADTVANTTTTARSPPLNATRARTKASASTGRSSGEPAKPKLMVVFASRASEEQSRTDSPRTMLLFDDMQVERKSDVPEEPSAELLPPLEGHPAQHDEHARGYGYPRPAYDYPKPQQDDPKPSAGYDYPIPQQDDPKPSAGYDYPKPQQDDPKPAAGYDYPKPQQDDPKPSTGYHYPKPQQDDQKPSAGYHYPKPQQDDPKPAAGYHYPRPQQDDPKPSTGYKYPDPQQDVLKPWTGYHYPKPQQDETNPSTGYSYPRPDDSPSGVGYHYPVPQHDPQRPAKLPSSGYLHPVVQAEAPATSTWRPMTPDQDYLPPKGQLPLDEPARPAYGPPSPPWSDHAATNLYGPAQGAVTSPRPEYLEASKPATQPPLQDELPFSHGQVTWPNAYLPPSHASYGPVNTPQGDNPTNGYLPPKPPLRDDSATTDYLPPKQPPRDDALASGYIPPKQPFQDYASTNNYLPPKRPHAEDAPADTYLPSKQPLRDDDPPESYLPPKQPLADDSYLPPKRPLPDEPVNSYGPPKATIGQLPDREEDILKSTQAQPRHLSAALRAGSVDEHGIRVTDMSCLRTAHRARFTATITSPRFVAWPPVLEAVPGGGAAPTDCRIIADPADPHHRFLVDLSNPDLTRCGVKGCSGDGEPRLCSRVLMPSLPGLRLASDPVLLLQCALQPASVSLVQQARLAAAQPPSARSAGVVHAGGERAALHAQLQLYRRGAAGEFSRAMQPGGAVHLGDELQLRATVRRGDGWQSSRLSDVVVRRGSDAVHLVGADGCSNQEMRAVCPRDQAWLAGEPLVSLLTMRVFMFRGMQDGDQLVLTARVVACLDRADCKLSVETCEAAARRARAKRSTRGGLNATAVSFEESVSFVVRRGPVEDSGEINESESNVTHQRNVVTAAVLLCVTVLPAAAFLSYWCKRRKITMRLNSS